MIYIKTMFSKSNTIFFVRSIVFRLPCQKKIIEQQLSLGLISTCVRFDVAYEARLSDKKLSQNMFQQNAFKTAYDKFE